MLLSSDRQPRYDTPRRWLQTEMSSKKLRDTRETFEEQFIDDSSQEERQHSAIHVIEEESEERYKLNSNSPSRLKSSVVRQSMELLPEPESLELP